MSTYYVGIGGNDSNNGTTWALRKLTIAGAEALSLVGDDIVYVGAGTYRETHTPSHSGTSGHPITFFADVTGEKTDNIGGTIRVTGSDDDSTATRTYCIDVNNINYRTWDGFWNFDSATTTQIFFRGTSTGIIVNRCVVHSEASSTHAIRYIDSASATLNGVEVHAGGISGQACVSFENSGASTLNNCIALGGLVGFWQQSSGTITGANCAAMFCQYGIFGGGTYVNCLIVGTQTIGVNGATSVTYSQYWGNSSNGDALGTGSVVAPYFGVAQYDALGQRIGDYWEMHSECYGSNRAGATAPANDISGATRPQGLNSDWGPYEAHGSSIYQETTTVNAPLTTSIGIAGRDYYEFEIPCVANASVTISCNVRWDDNTNIGTKPRLEMSGCGITTQTSDASGTGGTWEPLSVTATPTVSGKMIGRVYNRSTYTSVINAYIDSVVKS